MPEQAHTPLVVCEEVYQHALELTRRLEIDLERIDRTLGPISMLGIRATAIRYCLEDMPTCIKGRPDD